MIEVIGVVLDSSKNVYYFSPQNLNLKKGQVLLVETENGLQLGTAFTDIKKEPKENLVFPLKTSPNIVFFLI